MGVCVWVGGWVDGVWSMKGSRNGCVCVCVGVGGVRELNTHRMRVGGHSRELTKVTKSLTLKRSEGRLESLSLL